MSHVITFTSTFEVTDAEYSLVHTLYNLPEAKKVTAVKFIKDQYNIGLKQAKDICDYIGYHKFDDNQKAYYGE